MQSNQHGYPTMSGDVNRIAPSQGGNPIAMPAPQIANQLEQIDKALLSLTENANRLENHLQSVLQNTPIPGAIQVEEPGLVPMASALRSLLDRIINVDVQINHILNRLEL